LKQVADDSIFRRAKLRPARGILEMYALIYDEFDRSKREKKVLSVHRTREAADKALEKRQHKMDKRVWECSARIVWVYNQVRTGDTVTPDSFDTWAPDEKIPLGDRIPDGD
jgi:hypothetical protein